MNSLTLGTGIMALFAVVVAIVVHFVTKEKKHSH